MRNKPIDASPRSGDPGYQVIGENRGWRVLWIREKRATRFGTISPRRQ